MDSYFLIALAAAIALDLAMWLVVPLRRAAALLSLVIPVLAFAWAIATAGETIAVSWLLLGSRFGLDDFTAPILAVTAVLWFAAAVYGRSYLKNDERASAYHFFFTLTMIGNLGLIAALDVVTFLAFYTLMSVAAYGLVVHDRKAASIYAGRIYIVLTVAGEMLLFAGISLAVFESQLKIFEQLSAAVAVSNYNTLIAVLVLAGFGIKLGIMPLHVWLPLAHPAAPTPASAVLSGAMIKTGLVGMVRVLPFGAAGFEQLGPAVMIVGLATAFCAALIGATQSNAKTVLAYSSISQMGLVMLALGAALFDPAAWKVITPALVWFVIHHAVAKAALFLGYGVIAAAPERSRARTLSFAGLALAALAIAGLPFTTGYVAKLGLKSAFGYSAWAPALEILVPATSITTTLLLARFLYLAHRTKPHTATAAPAGMVAPWALLTLGVAVNWLWAPAAGLVAQKWIAFAPQYLWNALWPIALAAAIVAVLLRFPSKLQRIRVPEGDVLVPLAAGVKTFIHILAEISRAIGKGTETTHIYYEHWRKKLGAATGDKLQAKLESDAALLPLLCAVTLILAAVMLL